MNHRLALTAAAALAATLLAVPAPTTAQPAPAAAGHTVRHGCVTSRPEPGTTAPVQICYSLFRPASATATHQVPMILEGHGWGGQRTRDAAAFRRYLDRGYGVLSFDQRAWGESGGKAHLQNPHIEGHDLLKLVRLISKLTWVRQDGPGDPRLGAIGGSYGGGHQFLGAFRHLMSRGKPVFDALAPEITWWDLNDTLAPDGVARSEWVAALTAVSLTSDALQPKVLASVAEGLATNRWPDGSIPGTLDVTAFMEKNGPRWHASQGRLLDIPVLFHQGSTDTLFPLEQGLKNWSGALTAKARRQSIFVGFNGGHVLPPIFPPRTHPAGDPCTKRLGGGDFTALALRFFDEKLRGRSTGLHGYGKVHLSTPANACTTVRSAAADAAYRVGQVVSPTTAGVPLNTLVAKGPIRIAGRPYLTGNVTAVGLDSRAFYGLAVGTSPLDAQLVQANVLPVSEPTPVVGAARRVALPAVAIDVPAGQSLYLLVTPVHDTFVASGSRLPGVITIDDTVVHLPVVGN
ncbi:CocE/NonD family hydrolase [Nocardioides speluncae]|uniref:CocE/NonD family hydrolase n=1 Tax=Nocardioides speluncae TaxID=2670337 RepID=UPI000D69D449|nr:CocE/NonD family hydrolase [Nocardioides speluncae]